MGFKIYKDLTPIGHWVNVQPFPQTFPSCGTLPNCMILIVDDVVNLQFLVFINPFGGQGTALKLFNKTVKPMFEDAQVEYEVKVTGMYFFADYVIIRVTKMSNVLFITRPCWTCKRTCQKFGL